LHVTDKCVSLNIKTNEIMQTTTSAQRQGMTEEAFNSGILAIVKSQGRTAAECGKSIFDCPYGAGSEKSEAWMDAYMEAEKKTR